MRPQIIDVHMHTSTNTMRGLHVTDASLPAIQQGMADHGIEYGLVLATYFPFKGTGLHNDVLLSHLSGYSNLKAIGSLDAMNELDEGVRELDELARQGVIIGIKLYPGYQDIRLDDTEVRKVLEVARAHRLPVTIHGGELHHCCSARRRANQELRCGNSFCWIDRLGHLSHPDAVRPAVRAFPDLKFVVAHLTNPHFEPLRVLMRECPNVVTDISGQFVSGTHEDTPDYRQLLLREIKRFLVEVPDGESRVMFGSDFPIQSFEDSIWLVENLDVPDGVKANVFRHNALRVYSTLAH